jgi:type III secretory pathway component EscR
LHPHKLEERLAREWALEPVQELSSRIDLIVVKITLTKVPPGLALYEVALLFGTFVAETILASVHVRAHK